MGSFMENVGSGRLTSFLLEHYDNETFLVAVPSAMTGASIILETGKPVMAVGGFGGGDPILTAGRLEKMVEDGEVRYFLAQGGPDDISGNSTGHMFGPMGGSQSEINSWVKARGTLVPAGEWSDGSDTGGRGMFGAEQLYDLKGGQ
jgi:4-amino-4-deoxy-L-arabinose transferase-like glycosyltransferase